MVRIALDEVLLNRVGGVNPAVGWGLFTLVTLSDGNPNPVKWSALAGLAGNNLMDGRENDRWGFGLGRTAELLLVGARHELDPRSVKRVCEALGLEWSDLPGPKSPA